MGSNHELPAASAHGASHAQTSAIRSSLKSLFAEPRLPDNPYYLLANVLGAYVDQVWHYAARRWCGVMLLAPLQRPPVGRSYSSVHNQRRLQTHAHTPYIHSAHTRRVCGGSLMQHSSLRAMPSAWK